MHHYKSVLCFVVILAFGALATVSAQTPSARLDLAGSLDSGPNDTAESTECLETGEVYVLAVHPIDILRDSSARVKLQVAEGDDEGDDIDAPTGLALISSAGGGVPGTAMMGHFVVSLAHEPCIELSVVNGRARIYKLSATVDWSGHVE